LALILTRKQEDILEAILELQSIDKQSKAFIPVSEVVQKVARTSIGEISHSAILNTIVRVLSTNRAVPCQPAKTGVLLEFEPYKGVRLNPMGTCHGLRLLRKKRLAECLLVDLFDFTLDEAAREACLLEHQMSDAVADKIEAVLGKPSFCPHGMPIPVRPLMDSNS